MEEFIRVLGASKIVLRIVAALFAGSAIVVAAAAWRLSEGPISVGFLSLYIKDSLTFGGTDFDIALKDTVLAWRGLDRGLDIVVLDLEVLDGNGATVAIVPELAIGLDTSRLLAGDFVPATVDIVGATFKLRRAADGRLEIGVGGDLSNSAAILERLRGLTLAPDSWRVGAALRRVSITDATLTFEDLERGVVWHLPKVDLILNRDATGLSGNMVLDLDLGRMPTRFVAIADFDYVRRVTTVSVDFMDLNPQRLAKKDRALAVLSRLQLPVSGRISMSITDQGKFETVDFDLRGKVGALDLAPVFAVPPKVSAMSAQGAFDIENRVLLFNELVLERDTAHTALVGLISLEDGGPRVTLNGRIEGLTPSQIDEYWPTAFAPPVHAWFADSIKDGVVTEGTVRLNVGPDQLSGAGLPAEAVEARFSVSGVTARYFGDMPPITEGEGSLRLTGDSVDLELSSGRLGDLVLQEGSIQMFESAPKTWDATLEFVASGDNREVLRLINTEPLRLTERFGMTPDSVRGVSATRVRLGFPVRRDLTLNDLSFAAASNIREAEIDDVIGEVDLSRGNVTLEVTKAGIQADGMVALNGVPLDVIWRETFQPGNGITTQVHLSGHLNDSARIALGVPVNEFLVGEIFAEVDIRSSGRQLIDAVFDVDLTPALVDVKLLQAKKLPTKPARASFLVRPLDGGGTRIEQATFNSDALVASGVIELGQERNLRRIDLDHLTFGRSRVAASIRPRAPDGFIVAINGPQIDAGPFLDAFFNQATGELPPLNVSLSTDLMILSETRSLHSLEGEFNYAESLESLLASGSINGEAPINVELVTTPEGPRRLTIAGTNAGALARTTGLFDDAVGGVLFVSASLRESDIGPVIDGRMEITDLRVTRANSLARVLSLASLTGLLDVMTGEGLHFVRADVPFRFHDGLLEVIDARAFGPSLGITLDGEINGDTDEMSMFGTLVPAYTINSVLGEIPLIGTLLVGREGEGVFALTYGISGPVEEPVITVNPLSALAPGFLRNFFGIFTGGAPPDSDDPNRPFLREQPG